MNEPDTIENVCALVARGLYANADALAIEAGKYEELAAMLIPSDGPRDLESMLAGLLARDPGKWSSVWGDLQSMAQRLATRKGSHHDNG